MMNFSLESIWYRLCNIPRQITAPLMGLIGIFLFIYPAFVNPIGEFAMGSFIYGIASIVYGIYLWKKRDRNYNETMEEYLKNTQE